MASCYTLKVFLLLTSSTTAKSNHNFAYISSVYSSPGINVCSGSTFCTPEQDLNSGMFATSMLDVSCCLGPCSCHETCRFHRSCCVDAKRSIEEYSEELFNYMSCDHFFLQSKYRLETETSPSEDMYTMVTTCPVAGDLLHCFDYTDNSRTSTEIINDNVLVSSKDGRVIFRNEFCAKCHNVTDYVRWAPSVAKCEEDLFKLRLSKSDLPTYALEHCIVLSQPPDGFATNEFLCTHKDELVISSCNFTGEWDGFEPELLELCSSSLYKPVSQSENETYKNAFCLLCNKPLNQNVTQKCGLYDNYITPLGYILNLELSTSATSELENNKQVSYPCQDDEILDPYFNVCRQLNCPFQRIPRHGFCNNHFIDGKDISFALVFKLTFEENTTLPVNRNLQYINFTDVDMFLYQLNISSCDLLLKEAYFYFTKTLRHLKYISLNIHLQKTKICAENILNNILFKINSSVSVPVTLFGQTFESLVELVLPVTRKSNNGLTYDAFPSADYYYTEYYFYIIDRLIYMYIYEGPTEGMPCPNIILNHSDFFSLVSNQRFKSDEPFYATMLNRVIHRTFFVGKGTESLYFICLDDYILAKYEPERSKGHHLIFNNTKGLLTFILACLSLVSLILCIVLFCLSGRLKSAPSKIFVIGLINLFFAQGSFQFGVDKVDLPYLYCASVGVFVHYAWLSAVFALNAYCVLVAKNLISLSSFTLFHLDEMVKSLIYIYGLPFVFIFLNILYTWLRSGYIGYGQYLCYIDLAFMRAICFALPVFLTVVINCCVNTYIILKTRQTAISAGRRLQETRNAAIYFRLMLLTGIAWIFGFLNEIYSSSIFEYFFIILVAGQGTFLLIMFHFSSISQGIRRLSRSKSRSTEES